jgi:hypothetical protein
LTTYRATGRYDVKSPNCNIYKALFPEALRLEGLRLLKYQNDPEVVMVFLSIENGLSRKFREFVLVSTAVKRSVLL